MRSPFLFLLSCVVASVMAQAPERMSFQAVVRDASDNLVTNAPVGLRLSILQGSASGTAVYVETQSATTNANGLVSVQLGNGTAVSGSIGAIAWESGPYFLRTETDPTGGTDYTISGASELLSVPYALHAANNMAGPAGPQGPPGISDCPIIHTADGRAVVYTASTAHGLGLSSLGGTQWYNTTLDGPVLGSIASDSSVVLYTATMAYGFGLSSTGGSIWHTVDLGGTPVGALAASGRIVVFTQSQAHGFGRTSIGSTDWSTVDLSGPVMDHVITGNRIVVYTNNNAYGYGRSSTDSSQWYVVELPSTPLGGEGSR